MTTTTIATTIITISYDCIIYPFTAKSKYTYIDIQACILYIYTYHYGLERVFCFILHSWNNHAVLLISTLGKSQAYFGLSDAHLSAVASRTLASRTLASRTLASRTLASQTLTSVGLWSRVFGSRVFGLRAFAS